MSWLKAFLLIGIVVFAFLAYTEIDSLSRLPKEIRKKEQKTPREYLLQWVAGTIFLFLLLVFLWIADDTKG